MGSKKHSYVLESVEVTISEVVDVASLEVDNGEISNEVGKLDDSKPILHKVLTEVDLVLAELIV